MSLSDTNLTNAAGPSDNAKSHVDQRLSALLDAQAQALLMGQPFAVTPEQYGLTAADATQAYELLHLARRLSETMLPVLPSAEFVARLKGELIGTVTPALILRWRKLPAGYRLAARLGGLTITAGLALLASRRVVNLLAATRGKVDVSLNTVP
jgi:hypothetical protein